MVSWSSRKELCVALNMDEAEYMAARATSCEVVWIQKLLTIGLNLNCR
jgi:hypothetical protein